MPRDLWGNEEEDAFEDRPDQIDDFAPPPVLQNQAKAPAPTNRPSNIPAEPTPQRVVPKFEDDIELPDFNEEDNYLEVLNDAHLRLEQGSLYKMIMNHDLFAGMDADARAVANVQREIRTFARERMEVMLGMRQEPTKQQGIVSSPFNDLEVSILKKIASKATNGATETEDANLVAEQIKQPSRKTLNPIGGTTSARKAPPVPQKPSATIKTQPAPLQRKKNDATVEQILREEGVPRELLEEDYQPIGKKLHELSSQELEARQRQTAERLARRKTVKSATALPMATPEQQEMLAMQRASQIGAAPGMAALLEKVKLMPSKNS